MHMYILMKGQVLLFWKHLQQSAPIALPCIFVHHFFFSWALLLFFFFFCCCCCYIPCHWKFGWISHGLVACETITAASRSEAVVWARLLSDSHIYHPCLKLPTKKEKKNKGTDLICKAFIISWRKPLCETVVFSNMIELFNRNSIIRISSKW